MDQQLKQRLVGAVVITSLAVIFVPMLFDDPIDQSGKMIGELEIPPLPVEAVNSKLSKLPNNKRDVTRLPKPKVLKQLEAKKVLHKMERWFVQLGTFGDKSNAMALQKKIIGQGFPVKVKSVSTAKGVMYRVIVGPELNRKRAEQLKLKIDKLNKLTSILSLNDD